MNILIFLGLISQASTTTTLPNVPQSLSRFSTSDSDSIPTTVHVCHPGDCMLPCQCRLPSDSGSNSLLGGLDKQKIQKSNLLTRVSLLWAQCRRNKRESELPNLIFRILKEPWQFQLTKFWGNGIVAYYGWVCVLCTLMD